MTNQIHADAAGSESIQMPIQRWLVLTEFGVELQPLGNRGLVERFADAIRPYRRRTTITTEQRYTTLHTLDD